MRRFLKTLAGAVAVSAVVATGASALQVIPAAGGVTDDSSGPINANAARNPLVGVNHWPTRPFLNVDAVPTGTNTVVVHGSCGSWDPDPGNPRGTLTPVALDGGYVRNVPFTAGGTLPGVTQITSTFGTKFNPVYSDADTNRHRSPIAGGVVLTHNSQALVGEYPYGALRGPLDAVPQIAISNPAWAFPALPSSMGLTYAGNTVIGPRQVSANYLDDVQNDVGGQATLHPEVLIDPTLTPYAGPQTPLTADRNPEGPTRVVYRGGVEYLLYSDSYSTGPIDLDLSPINIDGSFDVRLSTAGLGPDTYTIRLLGCQGISATVIDRTIRHRINYYQGLPNNASGVFMGYNPLANLQNDNRVVSYAPTGIPGSGVSRPQQAAVGADVYSCWYPQTTFTMAANATGVFPVVLMPDSVVGNRSTNTPPNIEAAVADTIFGTYPLSPSVSTGTIRATSNSALGYLSNLVSAAIPDTGGYTRYFLRAIPNVVGRGPNEVGFNGNVQLAGPVVVAGTTIVPAGAVTHYADNLGCSDLMVHVPFSVLPLTSGYNGNTDFSCSNRYNNVQALAGAIFGSTNQSGVFGVINPANGSSGGTGAPTPSGNPTGGTSIQGGASAGTCPSGYDPVGIRANSILDYYARFRVFGSAAGAPAPAAPAFAAPANSQAASASQAATQAVITAAGGTPAAAPAATQTPAPAATQTPAPAATPAAVATPAAGATPAAQSSTGPTTVIQVPAPGGAAPAAETPGAPAAAAQPAVVQSPAQAAAAVQTAQASAQAPIAVQQAPAARVINTPAKPTAAPAGKVTVAKVAVAKTTTAKTTAKTTVVKKTVAKTSPAKATVAKKTVVKKAVQKTVK